jgi:dihydroorotate dehydrogenase (fumarate)
MGLKLKNPLIVGSSGLTKSVDQVRQCEEAGAGAVVLKSIFEEQIRHQVAELVQDASSGDAWGHPEAARYIEHYGREDAVSSFLRLVEEARKAVSIPVIASVHCVTPGTWMEFARRLENAGANALELNLHVHSTDPAFTGEAKEKVYFDVAARVKQASRLPVALKLSPYFSCPANMLVRLSRSGVDGLTLFTRLFQLDFDIEARQVVPARYISTENEHLLALRWISILSPQAGCDLAAATGVHDSAAVIKQLLAGARAVQVVSSLYEHGLGHLRTLLGELESWMQRSGYASIEAFRGAMSQAGGVDAAAFERVQFMKFAVGIE